MKINKLPITLFASALVALSGAVVAQEIKSVRSEPVQPLQPAVIEDPQLVKLGAMLFFEPRLSKSGFISCNSCHNLSRGGSDNLKTSIGDQWQQGPINSPTVLNSSLSLAQFWDGRASDLKEQAAGPIANPGEMAFTHELAIEMLQSVPGYTIEFERTFGTDKITMDMVTQAIAAFEETLVTPNSRFDLWLAGDDNAITAQELRGYEIFRNSGCVACHNGAALGGNSFQKMGLVEPYHTTSEAEGRSAVTGKDADRFNFKVPTLRNVELTYPYFHDGQADTLAEAVDIMGRLQLGKKFTPDENSAVVAFLKTLTGDQPQIVIPILPPSSDATPRPTPFQ
jgi:cytochrome c peroxidase